MGSWDCNSASSSLSLIQIARFQTKLVTCCTLWGLTRKTLVSVIATAYTGNKGEASCSGQIARKGQRWEDPLSIHLQFTGRQNEARPGNALA